MKWEFQLTDEELERIYAWLYPQTSSDTEDLLKRCQLDKVFEVDEVDEMVTKWFEQLQNERMERINYPKAKAEQVSFTLEWNARDAELFENWLGAQTENETSFIMVRHGLTARFVVEDVESALLEFYCQFNKHYGACFER